MLSACYHILFWSPCLRTSSVSMRWQIFMTSPGVIDPPVALKLSPAVITSRRRPRSSIKPTGPTSYSSGFAVMEPTLLQCSDLPKQVINMMSMMGLLQSWTDSRAIWPESSSSESSLPFYTSSSGSGDTGTIEHTWLQSTTWKVHSRN